MYEEYPLNIHNMRKVKYTDHSSVIRFEYKGRSVRFRPIEKGIVYIAVADIANLFMCHYINYNDLLCNCSSCAKIIFYEGKKPPIYAIETYDLPTFCRLGCHKNITKQNQEIIDWIVNTVNTIKNNTPKDMNNENNIQIFNNPQFGQVRVAMNESNEPLFCLADVCRALDLSNPSQVKSRLKSNGVQLIDLQALYNNEGVKISKLQNTKATFINEGNLYKCIFQSRKPDAENFQDWVCDEVLPSIRKHGAYMTQNTIQKALTDPDFLIQLATQLKEEQQKRLEAERKNMILLEDNSYKKSVIEGLIEQIPLADMRQRITQIMRKGGVSSIKESYHLLYSEFDKKFHVNVGARINNVLYSGSKMDYIEKELKMLPELYDLTCKLFESQYESLMKDWGKSIKRAQGSRN